MATPLMALVFLIYFFPLHSAGDSSLPAVVDYSILPHALSDHKSLCSQLVLPAGYPCAEHKIQTKDGFLLGLQRVSSRNGDLEKQKGPPILLLHGLFMAGDGWFLNSARQSLGFILPDNGFDVWIGNVRGTRWSHGHSSLSEDEKEFWNWSWEELALYDLAEMINYINSLTNRKIYIVGHSQGTIMSFAALTQPEIAKNVEAAALLSPISYLEHITAPLVRLMVDTHLDTIILASGFHELNFKSDWGTVLLDNLCDRLVNCINVLSSITGENCCLNRSRFDLFFEYEPHPSSAKNLHHLFQMIRKGSFSKYDYGLLKNLRVYGQRMPPEFDLSLIPESLPLWMAYGGNDELSDWTDLEHTIKKVKSVPELVYLENYGHVDFILSMKAKEDVYDPMIKFFKSLGKSSSL
ncbi:triacylglycerol lipase 1 isoform X1 [Cucumis melo var. makuwa]|uniref:Lipase n=1 Tax=Cucumis melo var. makuwa TaxID=1194695 RepID=A0A5A7SJL6_CUCMM|nr:triacylglycerol lipase 1 isoform X1 [Cucumis melo var. makuwa]TYK06787.1 triacylglycerol lipase 1 isoform X1 [Cucumis melo var. makuwa]